MMGTIASRRRYDNASGTRGRRRRLSAGAILNYAADGLASQVRTGYGIICHARAWLNALKAP
jgi:hypothetical protein